ncbi:MAG: Adaptive-response sensory-kinase SasA [Gammaproteobacteria bacterium]|nr:Adaptive-response sensory-kinase SasA [Gammaproteobacteria bacterium]
MPEPSALPPTAYQPDTGDTLRSPEFEILISELAADFVSMRANAIDDGIDRWLGRIVRTLGLDRMTVAQLRSDSSAIIRTHSYTVPGHVPLTPRVQHEGDVPWLAGQMRNQRIVLIPKVSDLPPEAVREREFMLAEGLKSNVSIPIVIGGDLIGWISFTSMGAECDWRPEVVNRLRLIVNIFAGALRRKRDDFQLERTRQFEELLSAISAQFVQLPWGSIDRHLRSTLQRVVEFLGVDRGTILTMSPDRSALCRTIWYARGGIDPVPVALSSDYAWMFGKLCGGEPMVVSSIADLPVEAAAEREYLERAGVRSAVAVPLFFGETLLGAAIFSALREEVRWSRAFVQRLLLLGGVLASALGRQTLEEAQRGMMRFEQLIADVSARLAAVACDRADEEVTRTLRATLKFFGADHCTLVQADLARGSARICHRANDTGITPLRTDVDYASACPLIYEWLFRRGETLVRSRLGDRPAEDAIDREIAEGLGFRSMVAIPISSGGRVHYGFVLASRRENASWSKEYAPRLSVLGDTLVNALTRARADEALRTSEERFRSVVESAPSGVLIVDRDGRIILANPYLERMFGYRSEAMLGRHVEMLLPLPDRERHHAYRREFISETDARRMGGGRELVGLRKDGTEIPVEIGLSPIGTSEGRFVLATVIDVTERKQAEQALRDSARRLAEAQRVARLGSWEWDVATERIQLSEEARRIVGVEVVKVSDLVALARAEDRLALLGAISRHWRERSESLDIECRLAPPDGGAERIVRISGNTYYQPDGAPLRSVGTIQDVSEARQAEEETRTLRMQLWHTDRVARSGMLTASLAHELNQPLTAILSNSQAALRFLASGNPDIAELRETLEDIVRDDKRAAAVISGLRAMVRHKASEREGVGMAAVLTEILALLRSELIGAGVELTTDLDQDCSVLADRVQLQQVVLNLVMNAVEAMRDSKTEERRISVSCRGADGAVQVRVQDTGPGIPPERRRSVFDAFATTKPQGMGLGLAVCRSIVESHGGRIWLEPAAGARGATFVFSIPAWAGTSADAGSNGEVVAR